jgi:ATP-binding cassette subfamily F protein uup
LDKIVDHLFVFEGDTVIKDFPGNYSQFKSHYDRRKKEASLRSKPSFPRLEIARTVNPNKLSFKEKRELELLEKEITSMELEKAAIETELHSGNLSADDLTKKSERFAGLLKELESLSDRWFELSEKE